MVYLILKSFSLLKKQEDKIEEYIARLASGERTDTARTWGMGGSEPADDYLA